MSPSLLDIPPVLERLNRRILCRVAITDKRLALTFDDGPNPRHTPRLLDILAAKRIRATFFVVGRYVRRFGEVVHRAATEGHEIGNHTDHHVPLTMLPPALVRHEISTTEKLIVAATGREPRFLRPPMGWFNPRVLGIAMGMGYIPVIGSVHPQDSRKPGTAVILSRIRRRVEPGAIIILHDSGWRVGADRQQTVEATDRITDELLAQGYRFETMSGLLDNTSPSV